MCSIFYAQESYTLSLSLSLSSAKKVFASVDGKESLSFFLSVKSVAEGKTRGTYTRKPSQRERIH